MISSFRGQYQFLSNFYPCVVMLDGEVYPSVEHAYQAAKTLNPTWRQRIREALTPGEAKHLGRIGVLRPDWDTVKLPVMKALLASKFGDRMLGDLLQATGDEELIEGNWWNDRFWGQCPLGTGENHLGRLLMEVRKELGRLGPTTAQMVEDLNSYQMVGDVGPHEIELLMKAMARILTILAPLEGALWKEQAKT